MQIYPYETGYGYKPEKCLAPYGLTELAVQASILMTIGKAPGVLSIRWTLHSVVRAVSIIFMNTDRLMRVSCTFCPFAFCMLNLLYQILP
jgi:hypothetical protein